MTLQLIQPSKLLREFCQALSAPNYGDMVLSNSSSDLVVEKLHALALGLSLRNS